ncbi:unnamed protein product [Orchesella dallaii]|uniref:Uncharacterized protein n=1 Tax=Orchesella dallaii TaxID=48710 RepID=A0ABP1PN62_9HEXA
MASKGDSLGDFCCPSDEGGRQRSQSLPARLERNSDTFSRNAGMRSFQSLQAVDELDALANQRNQAAGWAAGCSTPSGKVPSQGNGMDGSVSSVTEARLEDQISDWDPSDDDIVVRDDFSISSFESDADSGCEISSSLSQLDVEDLPEDDLQLQLPLRRMELEGQAGTVRESPESLLDNASNSAHCSKAVKQDSNVVDNECDLKNEPEQVNALKRKVDEVEDMDDSGDFEKIARLW